MSDEVKREKQRVERNNRCDSRALNKLREETKRSLSLSDLPEGPEPNRRLTRQLSIRLPAGPYKTTPASPRVRGTLSPLPTPISEPRVTDCTERLTRLATVIQCMRGDIWNLDNLAQPRQLRMENTNEAGNQQTGTELTVQEPVVVRPVKMADISIVPNYCGKGNLRKFLMLAEEAISYGADEAEKLKMYKSIRIQKLDDEAFDIGQEAETFADLKNKLLDRFIPPISMEEIEDQLAKIIYLPGTETLEGYIDRLNKLGKQYKEILIGTEGVERGVAGKMTDKKLTKNFVAGLDDGIRRTMNGHVFATFSDAAAAAKRLVYLEATQTRRRTELMTSPSIKKEVDRVVPHEYDQPQFRTYRESPNSHNNANQRRGNNSGNDNNGGSYNNFSSNQRRGNNGYRNNYKNDNNQRFNNGNGGNNGQRQYGRPHEPIQRHNSHQGGVDDLINSMGNLNVGNAPRTALPESMRNVRSKNY